MKTGTHKFFAALVAGILIALSLTACGGGNNSAADTAAAEAPLANAEEYYDFDEAGWSGNAYGMAASSGLYARNTPSESASVLDDYIFTESDIDDDASNTSGASGESGNTDTRPRKLVFSASIELETTEFDETAQALSDLVEKMGGYFSETNAGDHGSSHRWGTYTARIPAAKFDLFLEQAGGLAHETWRNESRQDVSENYYDTDGRLKTQKAKLDRLQDLLEKAENVEDMITIESAIAETEYQIDSLSGELRHYDNLVEYSTIEISLEEVYRLTEVEQVPESYISLLSSAFVGGLRNFAEWLEDLTVAIAYNWIWIVFMIAIVVILVKLGRAGKLSLKRRETGATGITTRDTSGNIGNDNQDHSNHDHYSNP